MIHSQFRVQLTDQITDSNSQDNSSLEVNISSEYNHFVFHRINAISPVGFGTTRVMMTEFPFLNELSL